MKSDFLGEEMATPSLNNLGTARHDVLMEDWPLPTRY